MRPEKTRTCAGDDAVDAAVRVHDTAEGLLHAEFAGDVAADADDGVVGRVHVAVNCGPRECSGPAAAKKRMRTAGFRDEGFCAFGGLFLLEVDDGEGRAAGADEGATEFVAEAAGAACDESDLRRLCERQKHVAAGRARQTLPAIEKSWRNFSFRALWATWEFHRTCAPTRKRDEGRVRGAWEGTRAREDEAGSARAKRRADMAGGGGGVGWVGAWAGRYICEFLAAEEKASGGAVSGDACGRGPGWNTLPRRRPIARGGMIRTARLDPSACSR